MTTHSITASQSAPALATAAVGGEAFRQALGRLAAGVSVITTIDSAGQKLGLTATAVTSVSMDPPLILICLGAWTRAMAPLSARAPFIVHLLADEQRDMAEHFATPHADKFAGVAYSSGLGGCPRLADALAWIECVPQQLIPAGDHTIVIGQVVALDSYSDRAPLIYFRRQFHTLGRIPGAY
jgi:flavin reductase (DIM6/NTAB) family NADH-FMN oxidoreductase RutF